MKSKNLSRNQLTVSLLCAVAVIGGLMLYNTPSHGSARGQIEQLAESLRSADKRGDAAAAAGMMEPTTALLRELNDASARGPCLLPAMHLSEGVTSVAGGGRWGSEDRFAASIKDCK